MSPLQPWALLRSMVLLLCLGTVLVTCLDCPGEDIRKKLEPHVMKHASSKFTSTFSEYYVTSLLEPAYRCGYMQTTKDAKKDNHYEVSMVVTENEGDSKRVRLSMSENKLGVLELKEKGFLVSKIYPVFVTDNVIGYLMCLSVKELNIGGDSVFWATVGVRTDKISEPGLGKDIQAAHDKFSELSEFLPKEIITLEKKKVFCPEKEVEDDEPSVEV